VRGCVGGVLLMVLLGGCQTLPHTTSPRAAPDVVDARAAQQQRTQALGLASGDCLQPGWAMAGRMAISNGKDAGAARFEWTQGEGRLQLQLTAPITAQTWVLQSDTQGAQLQGMPQGSQHGADAATLLRTATGWDIPIQALGCWMRAVAASEFGLGAAQIHFDGQLLPRQIEQGGWKIEYSRWQLDPFSGLQMPSRIDAQRGKSRVKLAIDRWGLE